MKAFLRIKDNRRKAMIFLKILVIVGYLVCHLIMTKYHEAWRDEAQCWALAKSLSLGEIYNQLSVEGHPILWFVVLKVLATMGLPYKYLCVFTVVLLTLALTMLLFCTDLPLHISMLAACSGLFVYQNPIVSRIYALIVLLVILVLMLWNKRYEKPIAFGILIALLFQSHVIMSGMAGGLLMIMSIQCIRERFRNIKLLAGTGIGFVGLVFLWLELFQSVEGTASVPVSANDIIQKIGIDSVILALRNTCLCVFAGQSEMLVSIFMVITACTVIFIFGMCVVYILKKQYELLDIFIVALTGYMAGITIVGLIYCGTAQMRITWFLCVTLLWCGTLYGKLSRLAKCGFCVLLASFFLSTAVTVSREGLGDLFNSYYSDSKCFANFVTAVVPDNSVILVSEHYSIPAAYAYLIDDRPDIEIFSIDKKEDYNAHMWREYDELSLDEWNKIIESFGKSRAIYYWTCTKDSTAPESELEAAPLIYDNISEYITDGNALYLIRNGE